MRHGDPETWRLTVAVPKLLNLPLYVRDVVGLGVLDEDLVPPRLVGVEVASSGSARSMRTSVADDGGRQALEGEWLRWWRLAMQHDSLLAAHIARRGPSERNEWRRELAGAVRTAREPDGPLGRVAEEYRVAADDWLQYMLGGGERALPAAHWPVMAIVRDSSWVGAIAREVADQRGAAIGEAHVRVDILFVEGRWWGRPEPGLLLCSAAVAVDRSVMCELLRERFDSSLTR